ncbi:hypothetical protein [Alkalinema sp. FACHB-956]|uniref:hypothetical protein n=1 Tax=Alkalinema sp. FACHB-956 TaxID=2692768 RepID=UPI001685B855|nr:hypothetical protein [Alkalinema sp. FACHB-956]MBD2327980.1 hypothetical protein [Alkalinema sp. FACHB-956]
MLRPHRPLIEISGHLLKYFCIGSLGFMVALLIFGAVGAHAIIPTLIGFLVPTLGRILAVICCLICIGVIWESIR